MFETFKDLALSAGKKVLGSTLRFSAKNNFGLPLINVGLNFRFKLEGTIKLLELKLDPNKKTLFAKIDLTGESVPVEIEIKKYSLKDEVLIIKDITVSKPWMDVIARRYLKEIPIPEEIAEIVEKVLA